uniref:Protein FAR1-RELATED SEQUENCE n=1 Tax=Lactuca sativa TaxID=4236 RepID=A0A9R1UCT3_LACSA|nr:hypothetical protein LSAT_V11C900462500 [Lactuca sativa]
MDDTVSTGDDHIHDQHEYPKDYAHDYEDFGLADHDSLHNIDFQISENSNLNLDNEIEFIDHEADYTIADDNIDLQKEQSHVTHDYVSSGGSSYWIPVVLDHIKPKINSIVDSYSATLSMYNNYASLAGFDVRLGPIRTTESDIITQRHLLCNREGKPRTAKVDTLDPQHNKIQRRKDSFRCECKTKIVFILVHGTNKYIVAEFVEHHNHELFGKDNMFLSRTKRKFDYSQEMFIHNLSKQNIGASRAHRLYTGLQGGSDIRGGLVSDFKNSTRNLNSYIGSRDAKFLADETAKYNYNAFGDVVSLDATFVMNKYDMVFVPFTGIDNHKKCVTFGAGLLSKEDGSSYSWLLRAFLKAFKKEHTLVLTDQDLALNKALNEVFPMSSHRCWVPTFFKDIPMSGLMRTTSLSKGQNWSFQNNTLTGSYLLMFMMTFEGVMERQRRNQFVNDFNTATTLPRFITSSPIEPHASKVYTRKKIYQVQKEISDFDNTCFQMSVTSSNGVDNIIVLKKQKNISTRQPSSPVVDDILEEYHYDCLIADTQYTIIGVELTNDVSDIENPSDIRNKGTRSRGKRLKSKKEMLEKVSSKPKRKCALCKQMANHDKRSRPLKNVSK